MNGKKSVDKIISSLQERAKELNCIYKIEEIFVNELDENSTLQNIVEVIPEAYQFTDICVVRLTVESKTFRSDNFVESPWVQKADIKIQGEIVGAIEVFYTQLRPNFNEGPFLSGERKFIDTIAERTASYIFQNKLKKLFKQKKVETKDFLKEEKREEWRVIIDLLRETDQNLYDVIARKMLNYLTWSGVEEAEQLLHRSLKNVGDFEDDFEDENRPIEKLDLDVLGDNVFEIASKNISDDEILFRVQKWIQEDKASFFVRILENVGSTIPEISDAMRRFQHITTKEAELPKTTIKGLNVSLIRRFLSDELNFISISKDHLEISDFYDLVQKLVYPSKSQGKIGGKSVGLFLAKKILEKSTEYSDLFQDIKTPKTWYVTSDTVIEFLHYNNLEDVIEQKYKDLNQIRQEYPYIVQVFKNSIFPPEILNFLSIALEDFGDIPLIVRSSSLLEDRLGAAFSGKYKSLFVANQGTKQSRLNALTDAISEVYASVFNTDPIEYRMERGLLDFNEEMGILIQEVVGTKVGKYYLPAYAGVAFSNNEFRWSPRIKREDGLIRLVPGLGTRAVDRLSDDYPVLIAPGKPGLRVNASVEEIMRYAPKKIDVINLEENTFETIEIKDLLNEYASDYPNVTEVFSGYDGSIIKSISAFDIEDNKKNLFCTFEKLVQKTDFISRMHAILNVLKEKMRCPVDIEFASDGKYFYLLQCRPQSYSIGDLPAEIPRDIASDKIIFTANKYISNGKVPDITHVVYVDPDKYNEVEEHSELVEIGRAVGKLNKVLPKRQFILMGPGRWGSRGDIKLGVNVTYSDINNTAVLIEIARQKGNYLPDLSFGTHFFQDLVEASIRYLPLYPDDKEIIFNNSFFLNSANILPDILPEYKHLSEFIKVIDVPKSTDGLTLKVLMNADIESAIALLSSPAKSEMSSEVRLQSESVKEDHWRWRYRMVEKIAANIDPEKYGVKTFYVFGSAKNATAGAASDINLLLHITDDDKKNELLKNYLNGWSQCLMELNYLRTGIKVENFLDVHFVTDEDIKNKSGYADKIDAVTDAAKEIPLKKVEVLSN
ncbi:MAG: pyruvate, phosphate dikinase [Ignavibacteria bacterium]|nr:pyruvate, phosphate dikinase [Ignavibacteria bacterium]